MSIKEDCMKIKLAVFVIAAIITFTGATVWEGAATVAPGGELPDNGYYAATNSFPRNTVVDVTNLENGKSVRVIVATGIETPGLLAVLSKNAASMIGITNRSVGRIRMSQPSDPIAFSRFTEGRSSSGDPDFDPRGMRVDDSVYAPVAKAPPDSSKNIKTPPLGYAPEIEWANDGLKDIIDLPDSSKRYPSPPPVAFDRAPLVVPLDFAMVPAEERPPAPKMPRFIEPVVTPDDTRTIDESLVVDTLNGEIKKPVTDPSNVIDDSLIVESVNEGIDETLIVEAVNEGIDESLVIDPINDVVNETLIADSIIESIPEKIVEGPIIEGIPEAIAVELTIEDIPEENVVSPIIERIPEAIAVEPIIEKVSEKNTVDTISELLIIEPIAPVAAEPEIFEIPQDVTPSKSFIADIKEPAYVYEWIPPVIAPAEPELIFSAPLIVSLEQGKYYVQLKAFNRAELVNNELSKIGKSYPVAIQNGGSSDNPLYRILLGPLNSGESGALLQRFKSAGYPDAFVRRN